MKTANSMRSLARAIAVIECFTPNELDLSGVDIARKVGMPKSTAYRILERLTESGLLEHNLKKGKFSIGPELYAQGSLYLSSTDILKAAEPVMTTLNDMTNEAVNLGILDKGNVIYVMKEESKHDFRWAKRIGTSSPAYAAAMGKALLAELTEAEIDILFPEERLLPVTSKTTATKAELKLVLERVRKTGIAFDSEGGSEGIACTAAVIRNATGKAVAAMSIAIPVFRIGQVSHERLSKLVALGSSLISYRLGYKDMANPVREIQEIRFWWEQNQLDSTAQTNNLTRTALTSRHSAEE